MDSAKGLDSNLKPTSIQEIGLKGRIDQARCDLRLQSLRLKAMSAKLQQKDQELLERCFDAQANNDFAGARSCADECTETRKTAQLVLSSQLALQKAALKLDAIRESDEPIPIVRSIIEVVQATERTIAVVVPEVARELGQISAYLESETVRVPKPWAQAETAGDEAKKILEQSSADSAERLGKEFRKLPNLDLPHVAGSVQTVGERAGKVVNGEAESAYRDALFRLNAVENELARILGGALYSKGRELSQRYDESRQASDYALAGVLADEYSYIRKVARTLMTVQLILQQISLRFESIRAYGDVMCLLIEPELRVILKTLRDRVSYHAPSIGLELSQIIETLEDENLKAGGIRQQPFGTETLWDIRKAVDEGKTLTDHHLSKKFPELASLPQELTTSCYCVLKTLHAKGGTMRMRELHDGIRELEGIDYDKSTLSDAVSRLSRLGLLTKLKDDEGGRHSRIVVSLNEPLPDWVADKLTKHVE